MKSLLVFIAGFFIGGLISSLWWLASVFGYEEYSFLWVLPIVGTFIFIIIILLFINEITE